MDDFVPKQIFDIKNLRTSKVNQRVMNFIATDNQPFSVVEDQGFIELIAHLQPQYLISSRRSFKETMLPASYEKLKTVLFNESSAADHVSFATDIWTNTHSNDP